MISRSDLQTLRETFAGRDEPGLPTSLSTDCARLLGVSDVTVSFFAVSDQYTLSASSDDARSLDEWEFTFEEGPCIDAAVTSTSNMTQTAEAHNTPWPRLSAKASAIGYRSIAGVPIGIRGTTFGTLNLHDRDGTITTETLANARHIAGAIAPLIVASLSRQQPDGPADHDMFHQATGMVMSQMGIAVEAAVEVLRAHAWAHDRLLTDVADEVVSHRLTFQEVRPD